MTTKLEPTITTKAKVKTDAVADGRKRPIVAINEDGKLVVCCRRTAKKRGWDIQAVVAKVAKVAKVNKLKDLADKLKEKVLRGDKHDDEQAALLNELQADGHILDAQDCYIEYQGINEFGIVTVFYNEGSCLNINQDGSVDQF